MNPDSRRRLDGAREALRRVDPGRDQATLTDLRRAVEVVIDVLDEEVPEARFTAKVLQDGVVIIPKQVRAVKGVEQGKYVTLDLLSVDDAAAR